MKCISYCQIDSKICIARILFWLIRILKLFLKFSNPLISSLETFQLNLISKNPAYQMFSFCSWKNQNSCWKVQYEVRNSEVRKFSIGEVRLKKMDSNLWNIIVSSCLFFKINKALKSRRLTHQKIEFIL